MKMSGEHTAEWFLGIGIDQRVIMGQPQCVFDAGFGDGVGLALKPFEEG